MADLKKCPFCGRAPQMRSMKFGVEREPRYGAVCAVCGICVGWEPTEDEAAAKWNRRDGGDADETD